MALKTVTINTHVLELPHKRLEFCTNTILAFPIVAYKRNVFDRA